MYRLSCFRERCRQLATSSPPLAKRFLSTIPRPVRGFRASGSSEFFSLAKLCAETPRHETHNLVREQEPSLGLPIVEELKHVFKIAALSHTATPLAKLLYQWIQTDRDLDLKLVGSILKQYANLRPPRGRTTMNSEALMKERNGRFTLPLLGRKTVDYFTRKVENADCKGIDGTTIGNILFGVQAMEDSSETRRLVEAMVPKLWSCEDQLDPVDISTSLYGLRFLPHCSSMQRFIEALTVHIEEYPGEFDGKSVSLSLYSLRLQQDSMTSRRCLSALAQRIQNAPGFGPQCVSNAMLGLRGKGGASSTHQVIAEVARKIPEIEEEFTSQAISNTLIAIKYIDQTVVIRQLLDNMACKIRNTKPMTIQSFKQCFSGLQHFEKATIKKAVESLSEKLLRSSHEFDVNTLAAICKCVSTAGDMHLGRRVLEHLNHQLDDCVYEMDRSQIIDVATILRGKLSRSSEALSRKISKRIASLNSFETSGEVRNAIICIHLPMHGRELRNAIRGAALRSLRNLNIHDAKEICKKMRLGKKGSSLGEMHRLIEARLMKLNDSSSSVGGNAESCRRKDGLGETEEMQLEWNTLNRSEGRCFRIPVPISEPQVTRLEASERQLRV